MRYANILLGKSFNMTQGIRINKSYTFKPSGIIFPSTMAESLPPPPHHPPSALHLPYPFDNAELQPHELSFFKEPDPDSNIIFYVTDTNTPPLKYALEFVDDGIRIFKEDTSDNVSIQYSFILWWYLICRF